MENLNFLTEKEQIAATFAYCQLIEQNLLKLDSMLTFLTGELAETKCHLINSQGLTRKMVVEYCSISDRTIDRKLKSGDIKRLPNGLYALSGELWDTFRRFMGDSILKQAIVSAGLNSAAVPSASGPSLGTP